MVRSIAWTIAGSDSGGGAGIQADLQVFQQLGVYGCSVITAITAQNSYKVNAVMPVSAEILQQQLQSLQDDLPPQAVKVGMLANEEAINVVANFLAAQQYSVVLDPVMISTSGDCLFDPNAQQTLITKLFPLASLITPNLKEAEILTQSKINTTQDVEQAAQKLFKLGANRVLIKGGHAEGLFAEDYYCDNITKKNFWLSSDRINSHNNHGSGCSLSSAIAALLAQNYDLADALVLAKMYVTRGIRTSMKIGQGPGPINHAAWPESPQDLPYLTAHGMNVEQPFAKLDQPIGFYPIVDRADWLTRLLPYGITTVQLRIKDLTGEALREEIFTAIAIAQQYNAQLFINDYWQLAIEGQAYGVHLGQEDLAIADIAAIKRADLRLGISTHSYAELATAHAIKPSYIAFGPIYPTTSKDMTFGPQGITQLKRWRNTLDYPLVAIGGINLQRLPEILACNVDGVAVISAITSAESPEDAIKQFMRGWSHEPR